MKFDNGSMVPHRQILLEHKFANGIYANSRMWVRTLAMFSRFHPPKEMWPVVKYSVTTLVKEECL